ncbi:MAG: hypothetical protein PHF37_02930 [Phycisphaerae bacterium]|nr:hypothetical protein [Phycisphaerae bacterium]
MKKNLIWTIAGCAFFFLLLQGCQKQQAAKTDSTGSNTDKMVKLIFIENEQLKQQLAQARNEMELQKSLVNDAQAEKQKLADEITNLQETVKTKIEQNVNDILEFVLEQNSEFRDKIAALEEQLAAAKVQQDIDEPPIAQ